MVSALKCDTARLSRAAQSRAQLRKNCEVHRGKEILSGCVWLGYKALCCYPDGYIAAPTADCLFSFSATYAEIKRIRKLSRAGKR